MCRWLPLRYPRPAAMLPPPPTRSLTPALLSHLLGHLLCDRFRLLWLGLIAQILLWVVFCFVVFCWVVFCWVILNVLLFKLVGSLRRFGLRCFLWLGEAGGVEGVDDFVLPVLEAEDADVFTLGAGGGLNEGLAEVGDGGCGSGLEVAAGDGGDGVSDGGADVAESDAFAGEVVGDSVGGLLGGEGLRLLAGVVVAQRGMVGTTREAATAAVFVAMDTQTRTIRIEVNGHGRLLIWIEVGNARGSPAGGGTWF